MPRFYLKVFPNPPDPKTLTVTVSFRLFQEETSFMKSAMDKVQSSYLRSLQEVGELLKKRAETIKNLKIWTRSLPTVTVTIRPPSAPFTSSGSTSQLSLTCKYCVLLAAPTIPDQTDPLRPQHISQSLYVSFLSGFFIISFFFLSLRHTPHTLAVLTAHERVSTIGLYSSNK